MKKTKSAHRWITWNAILIWVPFLSIVLSEAYLIGQFYGNFPGPRNQPTIAIEQIPVGNLIFPPLNP